jgi:hypothetical protein
VKPPLAFRDIQAADLVKWDSAQSSPEFEKLISDISIILGPAPKHIKETEQAAEEERKRKQEEETKRKESRRLYKVFVSSTFLDNQERRKLVQDAITMAGMVWHGMDYAAADRKSFHSSFSSRIRRYVWRIKMQVASRFAASLSYTGFF